MTMDNVRERVRATAHYVDRGMPDWWNGPGHAWKVTLRYQNRQLTTPFYQGIAHTKRPTAAEVLECLLLDASTLEGAADFEDWADELGYGLDSPKAERTYQAVVRQTRRLRQLLGEDYETALYEEQEG